MKLFMIGATVALVLLALCVAGLKAFAQERTKTVPLPDSCTLMAMTPAQREVHLRRLEMLRRSASAAQMASDGFTFEVALTSMPLADFQSWAENEQKCCSYLKIESRVAGDQKRANVHVICPKDLRNETMQSFGVQAGSR